MPCRRSNEHLKGGEAHLTKLLENRCQKHIGGEYKNRASYSGSSDECNVWKEVEKKEKAEEQFGI